MAYTDKELAAFTEIAYVDFETAYDTLKLKNPGKTSFTIAELKTAALATGTDKKTLESRLNGLTEKQMNNWKISAIHDMNDENGFYACIIETAPGEAAVGFRGSEDMGELDNAVNDWANADLGLVNSTCTTQQAEVLRFLEEYTTPPKDVLNNYDSLVPVGHSLGGNSAEYFTILSYKYGLDDNITQCASLDGPGFSDEFINKYREQIEKMSKVMYHPRWSFVGALLNDLPGVNYEFVQVENKGDDEYNSITRHLTKYLKYDEGKLIKGEQDVSSKIMSIISKGADHLPSFAGNILVTLTCGLLIGCIWTKENFIEGGKLTPTGWAIVAGAFGVLKIFGIVGTVAILLKILAAVVVVLIAIAVYEVVYDFVMNVVDAVCEAVAKIYNWAKEKYQQFKEAVKSLIDKAKEWFKNLNAGYKYASANPQIKMDTYKLRGYAQRLQSVNGRIARLDRRLDSLYWKAGLLDLWNLMQADVLTGYSWRLNRCVSYLNDTASDFDSVEREINNKL